MQLKKNNFVVTLKTEKEISEYFGSHIPEEQRLLWLGFFIAHNHIAHKLEEIQAPSNKRQATSSPQSGGISKHENK